MLPDDEEGKMNLPVKGHWRCVVAGVPPTLHGDATRALRASPWIERRYRKSPNRWLSSFVELYGL